MIKMSIKYALLGFLSRGSKTGFQLKKTFTDTPDLYWSDDGNKIYAALIQLVKEGLATSEIQKQASLPAKKVYSITESGLSELKNWVLSPEPPRVKSSFLIRLSLAGLLDDIGLDTMLEKYENEVKMQLLMQQERIRRERADLDSTKCSAYFWNVIMEHVATTYENELQWIGNLRGALAKGAVGGNLV